jgi:hypothetical protein
MVGKEFSRYLGHATSNVAEYVLMGVEALLRMGAKNTNPERLATGGPSAQWRYRIKDEKLRALFGKALQLLRQFDSYLSAGAS